MEADDLLAHHVERHAFRRERKRPGEVQPTKHHTTIDPQPCHRWPHRTALAVDAFAAHINQQVPLAATGDAAEDLVQAVARLAEQYQGRDGVVFAELIAAAVLEPGTADLLNDRFFATRRAALRTLWAEGVSRGQLDPRADADMMIDLLFGPETFRLLLGHGPTDARSAVELARAALRGFTLAQPHR